MEVKTVWMGLNTRPEWNLKAAGRAAKAESLREEIIKVVESEGVCRLSWECTGRTLHMNLACQWEKAMPQYDFEIDYDSYGCIVRKKK